VKKGQTGKSEAKGLKPEAQNLKGGRVWTSVRGSESSLHPLEIRVVEE